MSTAALAVAHAAADDAARIALDGLRALRSGAGGEIGRKGSTSDLVTAFDLAVERSVVDALRAAFPDDEIVGEEGTQPVPGTSGRRWFVDPIDGTTNFAHGLPFFCTSIGCVDEQGPAVSVIEAPALGWRFSAERGRGAFLRERGGAPVQLRVSRTSALGDALLATGFPYDLRTDPVDNVAEFAALQREGQAVRRAGAAALDLAMVAAGWFDGYWERKLKPWDVAAGVLLVTEAGGRVTDFVGDPYALPGGDVVASNGAIHAPLIEVLARVGGSR